MGQNANTGRCALGAWREEDVQGCRCCRKARQEKKPGFGLGVLVEPRASLRRIEAGRGRAHARRMCDCGNGGCTDSALSCLPQAFVSWLWAHSGTRWVLLSFSSPATASGSCRAVCWLTLLYLGDLAACY